jgi:RND family efflux transporter MFP subunit
MHETKSISDGDFAKIGFGLQQARAQQKLHTKNLAETKLFSPISGVVLKKLAETGEMTGTGIPVIVISDISKVKASVFIPECELHLVRTGQEAFVRITSSDSVFKGRVTEIGSLADPAARAFTVKIDIPNPGWIIRPGMIAEVTIPSEKTEEIIEIPVDQVVRDFNNQNYVYIVDEPSGKAFRRAVSLGRLREDQIEILSGITENELLVTGGQHKLSDGTAVAFTK